MFRIAVDENDGELLTVKYEEFVLTDVPTTVELAVIDACLSDVKSIEFLVELENVEGTKNVGVEDRCVEYSSGEL